MKNSSSIQAVGRKRRVLGWMLLALGVVVAGVWAASRWWVLGRNRGSTYVSVERGMVMLVCQTYKSGRPDHWYARESQPPRGWAFYAEVYPPVCPPFDQWDLGFVNGYTEDFGKTGLVWTRRAVLWPVPLLLWFPGVMVLRSGIIARRRAITGKCRACGYDLSGTSASSPCPECGEMQIVP